MDRDRLRELLNQALDLLPEERLGFLDEADLAPEDRALIDRLIDLYECGLALPPEERPAFLDEACLATEDHALIDELLARFERARQVFDELARVLRPPAPTNPDPLGLIGREIGHYLVRDHLGGGGMGIVYRAQDTRLRRSVALKLLPAYLSSDAQARSRFEAEAQAASALDHPNICTIHEIGEHDGRLFIAMAYYAGETLKAKIGRGPLAVEEAVGYAAQIAEGLARAHAAGIIHRDIKPANVIVTDPGLEGARGVAKILDFGLAKMADLQLTLSGTRMGTPRYMSPEQARGEDVDHRTDLWSLGATLYEALTGERPFKGDYPEAVLYAVRHETPLPMPQIVPSIPDELERVVARCLEKDREQRYPTAAALLADLEAWRKPPARRPSLTRVAQIVGFSVAATLLVLMAMAPVRQAVVETLGLSGLPAQKHLVVLAAAPAEADPADRTFTQGLVEILTRNLDRADDRSLEVVSTRDLVDNSVTTLTEAWDMFRVNLAILVEAVREGDTVRVTLDLVDAISQRSHRKATVVHAVAHPVAFDKDLVATLADLLGVDPARLPDPAREGTTVPGAHQFYLEGLGYLQDYSAAENIEAAIGLFLRALAQDSAHARAHAGLGEAYWRKYDDDPDARWIEKAVYHSQRALELNDDYLEGYVSLGRIETATGRYGSAIAAFRYALALDSAYTGAYRGLAQAYTKAGRIEEAEATYRRAIHTKPGYWGGYNELGVFLFNQGRYREAAAQFETVTVLAPRNVRGLRNLGAAFFMLHRRQDAFDLYETALQIRPDYVSYQNLAALYYDEGLFAEAANTFREALALQDTDYRVWGNLAWALHWSGQSAAAAEAYRQAIARAEQQLDVNPRDPETLTILAEYRAMTEDPAAAREDLGEAIALGPTDADVLFRIGEVYELLDERDLALAWIEEAFKKGYRMASDDSHRVLEALRADVRFEALLERYPANAH